MNHSSLITVDESSLLFHLNNGLVSYIFSIQHGIPVQLYYGKAIREYHHSREYPAGFCPGFTPVLAEAEEEKFYQDAVLQEYSGANQGDYRNPSILVQHEDGSSATEFRYTGFALKKGKDALCGLPSSYVEDEAEVESLSIFLTDELSQLQLELQYSIFRSQQIITRSAKITNAGTSSVKVEKIMSGNMDLPYFDAELFYLPGAWGRERQLTREKITPGIKLLDSKRGTSSHGMNPFVGVGEAGFTEGSGKVYGFALVYSGSYEMSVEMGIFGQYRVQMGINSFNFSWNLNPGEELQTPEMVMAFSSEGMQSLSQTYHHFINQHIVRGTYKQKERPILLNNWEATYMDFDEEKILEIAKEAADLGVELFVLDDGWFGKREDDTTSLGDWFPDTEKLPGGIAGLSRKVHELGLKFGLWVEPEMISQDSKLFQAHPDWRFQIPGRTPTPARNQYVLDLSRKEVRENIYQQMAQLFENGAIDYIKWDMNRYLTDVYSAALPSQQQGEVFHRYTLGLYELMERLVTSFPNILFEGCSGGGGRFDLGILSFMPQIWTSDNTDADARMAIQYGTSIVYPASTMAAHVSAVPNHQTGRSTPLKTRGAVAMSGVFGYELDPNQLTEAEKNEVKEQIQFYKQHRSLIQFGKQYRLCHPLKTSEYAMEFVSENQEEALLFYVNGYKGANPYLKTIQLKGLAPEKNYQDAFGNLFSGDELMNAGVYLPSILKGQENSAYPCCEYYLKVVES